MHVAIIGSGPVGMTAALLLARSGHGITLIDRDPGPRPGHDWHRVGVMQFHLPHGFRPQCARLLLDRLPDVYAGVIEAGAVIEVPPGAPAASSTMQIRRSAFERVLWDIASAEPGIERITGHVDAVDVEDGRATGVVVDSVFLDADLVVDASGRADRLTAAYRPTGQRVDTGMAYASRQYRLRAGAAPGPVNGGPAYMAHHRGYLVMVFRHEAGIFTVLFVRPSADKALVLLRHPEAFQAACQAIPALAEWTDPVRSEPIDQVRAGANLTNDFHPQPKEVRRLVAIGDAFCTTNPAGARGMTLGLQSAAVLADLVETMPTDQIAGALDDWGATNLLPWFRDHVSWDAALLTQWAGKPVDPDGAIGIEVLVAAAQDRHPEWLPLLGRFFGMDVLPQELDPLRDEVRSMVRDGWQPPAAAGPSGKELAAQIHPALAA